MKRKNLKQLLGLVLTFAMVSGMTGCGNQSRTDEGTATGSSTDAKEVSSEGTGGSSLTDSEITQPGEITYPLDTSDVLTIWSKNQLEPASCYIDYKESPFHTGLAENTGVEVEWSFPAKGADSTQAYNLLLAEEVLPDILITNINPGEAEQLINDGVIYDLTEYLPVYAPDYWKVIHEEEYFRELQSLTTDSGKFYSIPKMNGSRYNLTYAGPVIRKDWLDELGLDMPVTLEDWEAVLTAFKEKYGAAMGFYTARMNHAGIGSGVGAYGSFAANFYVDDSGKVQLSQAQPEWKEYMAYLNRWWETGLIDKDSLTMDDAAVRTKVLNGKIGLTYTAVSQLTNWIADAQAEGSNAEWVGLEYPRTAPGEATCMIHTEYSGASTWGAVVTTSCPEDKLITALKWMNYGYTEEGMMYWCYGTEGESYYLDDDGVVQWTELITADPDGIAQARMKYTGGSGIGIALFPERLTEIGFGQAAQDSIHTWLINTDAADHVMPNVSMTDEESIRYSDLMNAIATYVNEMALKFMTGEESLDGFEDYVEELNGMGLEEAQTILQTAYDRFVNK